MRGLTAARSGWPSGNIVVGSAFLAPTVADLLEQAVARGRAARLQVQAARLTLADAHDLSAACLDEEDSEDSEEDEQVEPSAAAEKARRTSRRQGAKEDLFASASALRVEFDEEGGKEDEGGTSSSSSEDEEEGEDDGTEMDGASNKDAGRNRRAKKARSKREELKLLAKEQELLDQDRTPETAADFERLMVAQPNNSFRWTRYMAYHLGMAEVGKAREIAERALKTINFRQEKEKFNVWVAYLTLENMYGTSVSLSEILKRALQVLFSLPLPPSLSLERVPMLEAQATYIQSCRI